MPRKLTFGTPYRTKPLEMWRAKGRKAPALLYVLPDTAFFEVAEKHGYKRSIGALAVRGHWWEHDRIYLRASRLDLFEHEWRHIETRSNFHERDDG